MECKTNKEKIHDYSEGSLSQAERMRIEEHLAACQHCRLFFEELQGTVRHLHELEDVEPPRWLTQRVMARVRDEASREKSLSRLIHRFRLGVPTAAVATILVAIVSVILMKDMQPKLRESGPATAVLRQSPSPGETPQAPQVSAQSAGTEGGRKEAVEAGNGTSQHRPSSPFPSEKTGAAAQPKSMPPSVITADAREERTESAPSQTGDNVGVQPNESNVAARNEAFRPVGRMGQAASSAPTASKKTAGAMSGDGEPAAVEGKDYNSAPSPLRDTVSVRSSEMQKDVKPKPAGGLPEERVIEQRHSSGTPSLVVTYRVAGGRRLKAVEERFDEQGRRHGLHVAYDETGKRRAEVIYDHGRIDRVREYDAEGGVRQGEPVSNWPWLGAGHD